MPDVITYTVTGSNTGTTVLDPVEITDSLSDVLDDAELVEGSLAASIGTASITGAKLTWAGTLQVAEQVTITYQVKVRTPVAAAAVLKNVAHGEATPPGGGTPIVPKDPGTEHPVVVPGFTVSKSSDPGTGTTVKAGQVITYTVTGANTGGTLLNPVTITDNLADVLDNAELVPGSLTASRGDAPALNATTLTWSGSLDVGENVVLTYQVKVKDAVARGDLVHNTVKGSATPILVDLGGPDTAGVPGEPINPPEVQTKHPVAVPGFTLAKSSDPVSGSTVVAGQVITYTVTGTNTGDTVLDPVGITDDLSGVLTYATLVEGSLTASAGSPPAVSGTTLKWDGKLAVGESVTLTYQVRVSNQVAGGTLIRNVVHGSATPVGAAPITPPDATTQHEVEAENPGVENPGDQGPATEDLAFTGAEVGWLSAVAIGLVLAGLVTIGLARRRV